MTLPLQPDSGPRWPNASQALGEVYASEWSRRAKYAWRLWLSSAGRSIVLDHLQHSRVARQLLVSAPRCFYPVMHKYLDRRYGTRERANAMVHSMRGMERSLGPRAASDMFGDQRTVLAELPGRTRVTLGLNELTFHEGLWAIDLRRPDGLRLFTISFGWTDAATLAIACVQGPPREIDGLQCVRELTGEAHGLRPAHLLVFMLRACAAAWNVTRLVGVDEAHQVKGRWNHKAHARHFDYEKFWLEISGTRASDGNWDLPLSVPQRSIEDVPTKRRAMYGRRYALLEALSTGCAQAIEPGFE